MPANIEKLKEAKVDILELLKRTSCHGIIIRLAWHDAGTYDDVRSSHRDHLRFTHTAVTFRLTAWCTDRSHSCLKPQSVCGRTSADGTRLHQARASSHGVTTMRCCGHTSAACGRSPLLLR